MDKLIITAALIGAEVTRAHNPNLPLSPFEISQEAYECFLQGASIIHLHARDKEGKPTQDHLIFAECEKLIKEKCNLIVQYSTGGAVGTFLKERIAPLRNNPEMATLSCGSVNFQDEVFENSWGIMSNIAIELKKRKIKPELEIFEIGMVNNALRLLKEGLIEEPLHFNFVMGIPGGIPASVKNLLFLIDSIPHNSTYTVSAMGRYQLYLTTMAVILGGHVRLGFEDNIYYTKGVLAKSSAQLIERTVRIAKELGREIANPDEARNILKIKQ
ncbi:MAG: 3-keto-5-aminohexanoate cleavage protein [Armatimonadetes bacterium]|nr:3-keto-5-aminohexanoate cleavage protein [Armatimonadota bacterium]